MNPELMDGFEYSLWEIDQALTELAPQMQRKMYREVIINQINELLDQRNELVFIMGATAMEDMLNG